MISLINNNIKCTSSYSAINHDLRSQRGTFITTKPENVPSQAVLGDSEQREQCFFINIHARISGLVLDYILSYTL